MPRRKNRKSKQQNGPTYPNFSLKQNGSEPDYNEKQHYKRENFDNDDPLISAYGGHYGHASELKPVKNKPQKSYKSPKQKKNNLEK